MSAPRAAAALVVLAFGAAGLLGCASDDDSTAGPTTTADDREVTGPPIDTLDGAEIYETSCAACHQSGGVGIEGVYPALADSAFVSLDDPAALLETIVHGRAGMPAWGSELSDSEIAAVASYLRTDLNDADPVEPEAVRESRDRAALETDERDADDSQAESEEGGTG